MSEITLTDSNFEAEVLKADMPVLVDFWAEWCGPCRMLSPVVEKLAEEYQGKIKVGKLNVDESPNIAAKYGIQSIPTLMVFNKGEMAEQNIGVIPKEKIASMFSGLI